MSEIAEKVNPSTDGQMKDLTSVLVTAMPDHEKFPRESIEYWMKNKRLLAAKVRAVLEGASCGPGQSTRDALGFWERFYREILKIKVDFSDIDTPSRLGEFRGIVPVVSSVSTEEIIGLLSQNFGAPFTVCNKFIYGLDGYSHLRPEGHYAVLHRGTRMPDLDMWITMKQPAVDEVTSGIRDVTRLSTPVDASSFMSPKEYILFTAYSIWMRQMFHCSDKPSWYDSDGTSVAFPGEQRLLGTSFPQLNERSPLAGLSILTLGCPLSSKDEYSIVSPVSYSTDKHYGRLVKVLPSLRIA